MVIDIIGYVDVEEMPTRYNADGTQWMDSDFRWHEVVAEAETVVWQARRDAVIAEKLLRHLTEPRICAKCGSHISYVGKGRPRKYCGEC